jgi:DNA repair exonuclease SbcCD ATPase subunit
MAETSVLLSGIDYKVRKLIQEYESLKERYRELKIENDQLKTTLDEQEETLNRINQQVNNNTIIQSLGSEKETIEKSQKRIQHLIAEIDQCLDVLSR